MTIIIITIMDPDLMDSSPAHWFYHQIHRKKSEHI